jgi:hypothetical protein
MAVSDIQTSLAAGELSPQLYARVDLDKFQVGAALLRNFFVDYRGGVSNRAGTEFIAQATGGARLIPFVVSTEAAYVLMFTNQSISIFNQGVFLGTVAVPYVLADLFDIAYTQSADVLTLVHPSYPPADLSRDATLTFTYTVITTGPDISPPVVTTMVAPHSGPYSFGYLVTAVDVNGKEESLGSNPAVKHSEGMNELTNRVIGLSWTPPAQGVSRYNVYKWGPIDSVTLNPATVWGFIGSSQTTTFTDNNIAPDFSKQPPGWGDPFSGGQFESITVATGGAGYDGVAGDWPTAVPYVPLVITGDGTGAAGYAVIDHALGTIIGVYLTNSGKNYTHATVTANGQGGAGATFNFTFTDIAPLYPAATAYLQQRRVFGGSLAKPETVVMSQPGLITNFNTTPVTLATDAIVLSISAEEVNTIKSFVQVNYGLLAFTTGGSYLLNGGTPGAAIDANPPSVQPQVSQGANNLRPLRINYDVIYGQAKGNRIHNLAFAWQKQSYAGSDISTLAAHLFDGKMTVDWAYAEEPFKIVWAVRNDGRLLSLTYVPDQEVYAWARHDTQGLFKSVCSVPENNVDAVYFIVERHIPGAVPCWQYFLERMAPRQGCCIYDAWHLDCALSLAQPTNLSSLYMTPIDATHLTLNTYDPCSSPSGDFGGIGNFPAVQGIQNFDLSTFTGGNYRDDIATVDWDNGHLYIHSAANGLIGVVSTSTFLNVVPAAANANYQYCMTVGENGFVYYAGGGGPNCTILHKAGLLTPAADIATFGVAGGPFQFVTDANHWSVPIDMDVITTGTGNWLVSIAADASQTNNEVPVINLDTMQWSGFSLQMDEPPAAVTRGSPVDSDRYGFAFTVGVAANKLGVGLYRVNCVPILSATKVKLIPASTFGVGWTHVDSIVGLIIDETDGNLICHAASNAIAAYNGATSYFLGDRASAGGHDYSSLSSGNIGHAPAGSPSFWKDLGPSVVGSAIVKFTSYAAGGVMWSVPIGAIPSTPNANMNCSRVKHGVYCYMDPAVFGGVRSFVSINTLTGAFTRTTEENLFADVMYYNDYTGQGIFSCSWADLGAGHVPRPIGTTPGSFNSYASLGHTTGFPAADPPSVVGQIVQVGCGKIQITAQASATSATGLIIAPLDDDAFVADDPDGLLSPVASGDWTITTPTRIVSGLNHLEGKQVWALADGVVVGPLTVVSGAVDIGFTATNIVVGLKYTQQVQTLYLTTEGIQEGSDQGKRKQISGITLRVDCSKGMSAGTDFAYMTPIPELNQDLADGALYTGDARVLSFPQWDRPGQTCIEQDLPLPATVLGLIVEVTPGDTGS